MRAILVYKRYLTACIALSLMLCLTQIMGYTLPIVACLGFYMILVVISCCANFTLPILLFFLPWSPVLRTDPSSHSVYTFGMVFLCLISIAKKRFYFRNYQLAVGILLLLLTLLAKALDGSSLAFDYIAFIMMIVLFPSVKEEWREEKYDFYQLVIFFALGVILASLCALFFAEYGNIRKYIRVDSYLSIVRRSGFYGDANFYTAQILAALGGALALLLKENRKGRLTFLGITVVVLLYCGFLSGSKSFLIVAAIILFLWITAVLKMRGRTGLKAVLLICLILTMLYIVTSTLFGGLIQVVLTRLVNAKDLNSFTTGRVALWEKYLKAIFREVKVFFIGKGFTDIKIDGRASHNTILQIFFQFGIIGFPMLAAWTVCFFKESKVPGGLRKKRDIKKTIVFVGTFLPWFAIDALFFDEFFLLQWYMFMALRYFNRREQTLLTVSDSNGGELWKRE